MKFAVGTDHAGFRYKEKVKAHLRSRGHQVEDFGTHSEERVDYPDFILPAARAVATGACQLGLVFGGSGNGEAMTANKLKGIRCAVCWSQESAALARGHNDANMISIGQRLVAEDQLTAIVDAWLDGAFEGGRHVPRIEKMGKLGQPQ